MTADIQRKKLTGNLQKFFFLKTGWQQLVEESQANKTNTKAKKALPSKD